MYSNSEINLATNISAILGWSFFVVPMLRQYSFSDAFAVFIFAAIFGLPLAFLFCWMLLRPILKVSLKRQLSWISAALWGLFFCLFLVLSRLVIVLVSHQIWTPSESDYTQTLGVEYHGPLLFTEALEGLANSVPFIVFGGVAALIVQSLIHIRRPK